jgi:hypothetical protein
MSCWRSLEVSHELLEPSSRSPGSTSFSHGPNLSSRHLPVFPPGHLWVSQRCSALLRARRVGATTDRRSRGCQGQPRESELLGSCCLECPYEKELDAERALAASRGHQYAEVIDIGVEWDTGAPLPHLVSNGGRASVLFYARAAGPSAADSLGIVEFRLVASIRMGAPNDEALDGHPLHGRGLPAY